MKMIFKHSVLFQALCFLFVSCEWESSENEIEKVEVLTEGQILSRKVQSGKQNLTDGSRYEGELIKGKPHGFGKREFLNGDSYEGQFERGKAHGHGTFHYKNDDVLDRFVGMWLNDRWDGFGVLFLQGGSKVSGKWVKDKLEYGNFEGSDGSIRSGKWYGNWEFLEEGYAKNIFGAEFNGLFNADGSYSAGVVANPNGDLYSGEFQDNEYHGRGILKKADGTLYVGQFANNLFSGKGVLLKTNGSKFSGEFLENLPDGLGVEKQVDGVIYSGEWSDGRRHGMGTVDFGNGTSYVGEFRNGLAYEGQYNWGDGRVTDSYQDETGTWLDR